MNVRHPQIGSIVWGVYELWRRSLNVVNKIGRGRPPKVRVDPDQPTWICNACGVKYGSFRVGIATWHQDTCGCCGRYTSCTEPRDYGYLLLGWKDKRDLDGRDDNEA